MLVLTLTIVSSVASSKSSLGTSQPSLGVLEDYFFSLVSSFLTTLIMVDWLLLGAVVSSLLLSCLTATGYFAFVDPERA